MQHIILLRGLPGAGKSALAAVLSENNTYPFFSVDDYFTDKSGKYIFEFSENHKAYAQCISNTEKAILDGAKKVLVHNTFTMLWEMEPYFNIAKKHHCMIHVLTVENYHGNTNIHDVTPEQLSKMAEKYDVRLF